MSVEIVYYNTPSNPDLEGALGSLGKVNATVGQDRRGFLMALSAAVSVSPTIVAVGGINALTNVLSKGLGLPLTPVDWTALGIAGEEEVLLPKGALPLLIGGTVCGMIIENAAQCIIVTDDEGEVLDHLTETYILPYLQAVISNRQEQPAEQSQAEAVEEPTPEAVEENAEEPAEEITEEIAEEVIDEPAEQEEEPSLPPDEEDDEAEPDEDIFADLDEDDFLTLNDKKKKGGWLVAILVIFALLTAGIVGGYFAYTKWWVPNQYDVSMATAKAAYYHSTADDVAAANMPDNYSVKFAALYKQNADVICWLKVGGMGINTPVVTASRHSKGYYENHLFDGKSNNYGTPYIEYAYDTGANINPNLVIYGNNTGDKRAFSRLEELLGYKSVDLDSATKITTDSVLFGEENWNVISVMLVNANGSEFNFADNFKSLDADQRTAIVKDAIKRSVVKTDVTVDTYGEVDLTDAFLTLVTPYSKDESKVVVVFAQRTNDEQPTEEESVDEQPTEEPAQ